MKSMYLAWQIRRSVVEMTHKAHASHIGSVLSVADIVAVLYADILKFDVEDPQWPDRDRFILSKGHAGAAVYIALAECGFFPREQLSTYCDNGSLLSGHVSHYKVPGVEFSTGSLGHGLSVASGIAFGMKEGGAKTAKKVPRVFVVMGDGECQEGAVWEAALFAAQHKLENLTAIVDFNGMQGLGLSKDILNLSPFQEKWRAFGWRVKEVDGHDHEQLKKELEANREEDGRPFCLVARTKKGRGISFMEDDLSWHYRDPQGEDYEHAKAELEAVRPIA